MQAPTAVSALGLTGCGTGQNELAPDTVPAADPGPAPLDILILGGTGFIGPHMVRYAQSRGHNLTLFNRGQTNPGLFAEVEQLRGDRDGDLAALEGRTWDAVIDNSGFVPRIVQDSAQLLKASGRYIFISTLSVYSSFDTPNADENHPLGTMEDSTVEEVTGRTYGPLKSLCEERVQDAFAERSTIIRPGYIVGPGDRSDRWTYWPVRVDRGGVVLAPGRETDPMQVIDARDLAAWTVRLAETRTSGTFNAVGPANPMTMGELLESAQSILCSDATFTWVDAEFLSEHDVSVPIWVSGTGDTAGMHRFNGGRAWASDLTTRPIADTVADTVEWWKSLDEERNSHSDSSSGLRIVQVVPIDRIESGQSEIRGQPSQMHVQDDPQLTEWLRPNFVAAAMSIDSKTG